MELYSLRVNIWSLGHQDQDMARVGEPGDDFGATNYWGLPLPPPYPMICVIGDRRMRGLSDWEERGLK